MLLVDKSNDDIYIYVSNHYNSNVLQERGRFVLLLSNDETKEFTTVGNEMMEYSDRTLYEIIKSICDDKKDIELILLSPIELIDFLNSFNK